MNKIPVDAIIECINECAQDGHDNQCPHRADMAEKAWEQLVDMKKIFEKMEPPYCLLGISHCIRQAEDFYSKYEEGKE